MKHEITLGPVLFHWPEEKWKDFYFRIADEAPVDTVYLGEVVCSKRAPFYEPHYLEVAEYLQKHGKKVVFSTLAEVTVKQDRKIVESMCGIEEAMIEANDASALFHLAGRPHAIGPFVNAYNEDSLTFLAGNGAKHFCFPAELSSTPLQVIAEHAAKLGVTTEVQVYGRIPLALSARCYHARAHGRVKDNCQFVCEHDADGMELKTLEKASFLAINGIQTLSHSCLNLIQELDMLKAMGISHFRISPHSHNMVKVIEIFRSVLNKEKEVPHAIEALKKVNPSMPFSNGFYYRHAGCEWSISRKSR